jgi:hypothetical protein
MDTLRPSEVVCHVRHESKACREEDDHIRHYLERECKLRCRDLTTIEKETRGGYATHRCHTQHIQHGLHHPHDSVVVKGGICRPLHVVNELPPEVANPLVCSNADEPCDQVLDARIQWPAVE